MISRRTFLGGAAGCALSSRIGRPAARLKLREFAYSQVKLTSGPMAGKELLSSLNTEKHLGQQALQNLVKRYDYHEHGGEHGPE